MEFGSRSAYIVALVFLVVTVLVATLVRTRYTRLKELTPGTGLRPGQSLDGQLFNTGTRYMITGKPSSSMPASATVFLVGQAYETELALSTEGEFAMWPLNKVGQGAPLWTSGVKGGARVTVSEGRVSVYGANGQAVWMSKQIYDV